MDRVVSLKTLTTALESPAGRLSLIGLLVGVIPLLASLLFVAVFSSTNPGAEDRRVVMENAAAQRAALIKYRHDNLISRVETALASAPLDKIDALLRAAAPDAQDWQVIPLNDMGIASLRPSDFGHQSLVLLDRVRRTFSSGESGYEAIRTSDDSRLYLVSRFESDGQQGVTLIRLSTPTIDGWVTGSTFGSYSLWQNVEGKPSTRIAGLDNKTAADIDIPIDGSQWTLSLSPASIPTVGGSGLAPIIWLIIILSLVGSIWLCIYEPRRRLRADVLLILENANTREPISVQTTELIPVAKALRQLVSNNKIRRKRADADHEEKAETQTQAVESPKELKVRPLHAWAVHKHSWVVLPPKPSSDEIKAIDDLAHGLAALSQKNAYKSFFISTLGDDSAKAPKSQLAKTLLSCGVDLIDLDRAPLPVVHMAVHDSATTHSALVVYRDKAGSVFIGALINRCWVSSNFWQAALAFAPEMSPITGDGRSVKVALEQEYCQRITADIVPAESLRLVVACNDEQTLNLATTSLESVLCSVEAHLCDEESASTEMASWLSAHSADLAVFIDAQRSALTVFDETGQRSTEDQVLMLIMRDCLAHYPGGDILLSARASKVIPGFITSCGGASKLIQQAPYAVQKEMQSEGALIAGDSAGSIYIKDRWHGSNDPLYSAARIIEIVSNENTRLSELLSELPATSFRMTLIENNDVHKALSDILTDETLLTGARLTEIDGLRVDFADSFVFLADADQPENSLLCFEGDDVESRVRIETLILDIFKHRHPELTLTL